MAHGLNFIFGRPVGLALGLVLAGSTAAAAQQMHLRTPAEAPAAVETVNAADDSLPDAPEPAADAGQVVVPKPKQQYAPFTPLLGSNTSKYRTVINPGEDVPHWGAKERFIASLNETFTPTAIALDVAEAGINHWQGNDPKYGSDSGAFGERVGATVLRSASDNIISDGILSDVFGTDPRYYRRPDFSFWHRVTYASSNALLTYSMKDHKRMFDYSGVLGRAIGSGLTMTYYPRPSANVDVAARTFGYSLLGEAGGSLFNEFIPDIWAKLHKNRQQ